MERILKLSIADCALVRDAIRDHQVRLDQIPGGPELAALRGRAAALHAQFNAAATTTLDELPGWQPGEVTIQEEA